MLMTPGIRIMPVIGNLFKRAYLYFGKGVKKSPDVVKTIATLVHNFQTYIYFCVRICNHVRNSSTALAVPTVPADKTAFLINEVIAAALRTFLAGFIAGAIRYVFLERALNTVLPGIYGIRVK